MRSFGCSLRHLQHPLAVCLFPSPSRKARARVKTRPGTLSRLCLTSPISNRVVCYEYPKSLFYPCFALTFERTELLGKLQPALEPAQLRIGQSIRGQILYRSIGNRSVGCCDRSNAVHLTAESLLCFVLLFPDPSYHWLHLRFYLVMAKCLAYFVYSGLGFSLR